MRAGRALAEPSARAVGFSHQGVFLNFTSTWSS
jgi:hypothetical protein